MTNDKRKITGSGWQRRGWGSTRSTVVLGGVLAVCLAGAAVMVGMRSGQLRARENTAKLLKQVAQQRLESWLGYHPVRGYYIMESEGKAVGFSALQIEGQLADDNTYSFTGGEIYYSSKGNYYRESSYEVAGDLSSYRYTETTRRGGVFEISRQEYRGGVVTVTYSVAPGRPVSLLVPVEGDNFIPLFLLDALSSVAVQEGYEDGVVFSLLKVGQVPGGPELVRFLECWVRPGGEVPEAVRRDNYDGRSVAVQWLRSGRSQQIYYGREHQLVWQRDVFSEPQREEIMRVVSESELYDTLPEAKAVLHEWRRSSKESDAEEL